MTLILVLGWFNCASHNSGIGRDPTVVQSARAPRLWESDRHIIRENAIDDMGMEASRTYLGSKVVAI